MFFSGIREIASTFERPVTSADPKVNQAVDLLNELKNDSGLGFFGKRRTPDALASATRLLQEHGKNLSHAQTIEVVGMLQKLDEARAIRRRFVVQVVVTAAVLAVAGLIILNLIHASDDLKKVAYGFVGTTIGYWLK